jgi:hypothetical protein
MAATTAADPVSRVDTGMYRFFGRPVPPNVVAVDSINDFVNDRLIIRWKVGTSTEVFTMDLNRPPTDDAIFAVLAAMRLSC